MWQNVVNNKQLKKINRLKALDLIRRNDLISRAQLSKLMGLTPPAVTGIVKELISLGIICEVGFGDSQGGRKPVSLVFNSGFAYLMGGEVSKDCVSLGFTDMKNPPVNIEHIKCDMSEPKKAVKILADIINTTLKENLDKNFLGIGLAVPGLIKADTKQIVRSVNLGSAWRNFNLVNCLQPLISVPLFIDNNSNMAVMAEKMFNINIDAKDMAYINIGDGVSAGIICADSLFQGYSGFSGELGHIFTQTHNVALCNCGNSGCLETVCSLSALLRKINSEMQLVRDSDPAKQYWLQEELTDVQQLMELAKMDSPYIRKVYKQFIEYVGIAISYVINMFNPEYIILGGKMALFLEAFLKDIIKRAKEHTFPELFSSSKIVISNMREEASVSGACALALQEILSFSNNNLLDNR